MTRAARASAPAAVVTVVAVACAVVAAPAVAQDLDRGGALYDKWCAECHGVEGAGDGSAAAFMLPRPRDLTRALYQIRTTASGELPTDADIRRVIEDGMPGTAMPGWKARFRSADVEALVAYVKSFSRFFEGAAPEPLAFPGPPRGGAEAVAEGRRVYQQLECFKCHGDEGRGDGTSAPTLTDDWDFPIRAADLSEPWAFNGGSTVEQIYRRLRTGLDGTPMPSFSDVIESGIITDDELWRVARYVRGLSPTEGAAPRVGDVVRAVLVEGALPGGPGDTAWAAVERFYLPLVGQIIEAPRAFAPRVDGVWVQAVHDGERLAMRVVWSDPSQSPDPAWQEWLDRMRATLPDVDGPLPAAQGPDRLHVQFPATLTEGLERPYFAGGDAQRPVYQWRWTSEPDRLEAGIAGGLDRFVSGTASDVAHAAEFHAGQWRLQITRPLVPADTGAAPTFVPGRPIPLAVFAADGSDGEGAVRGALSAWYAIYLDVPTPATAYVVPVIAMLLTGGLGMMVVWRAQHRERQL